MADEQQLAVLRQGSDAWNAWREQNTGVQVDLKYIAAYQTPPVSAITTTRPWLASNLGLQ